MSGSSGQGVESAQFQSEREELEAVLECGIFGAHSNAAKLLRFVCKKHFENPEKTISE
jgi:hypothetical protein